MGLAIALLDEKSVPQILRRCLILALCIAAPSAAMAAAPRRIVSLNLCADQLLLALADPGQIAALTQYARDPDMSAGAARAMTLPISQGRTEDVLALDPDLILANPGLRRATLAALDERTYRIVELPSAESYPAIVAQIRTVAEAVGHPERGDALIARMDADLARLPRLRSGRVAAYYQRRGYLTGTGTLIDDLMRRVGLRNLATVLGKPPLSRVGIEEMVVAHPDYLIVENATDRVADQGTEMLHHPALADIRRLHLPEAWTVCGGPAYVLAARSLVAQLREGR
jgi:iron complex transport system substrate-binding protein